MTHPIRSSQLLRTAEKLAGRDAGRGRPALCDLRRGSSTAYYALFHQITRHGAAAAIPTASEADISNITRWFTHTGVRQASDLVVVAAGPNQPRKPDASAVQLLRSGGNTIDPDVLAVAESFASLQDSRHAADYDHDYNPVRFQTLEHVDAAELALRRTWSLWRANSSTRQSRRRAHDAYHRYLCLALLKSGGPRTR